MSDLVPYTRMQIGGVPIDVNRLPKGLRHASDTGVIVPEWMEVRTIHRFPQPDASVAPVKNIRGYEEPAVAYVDCPRPIRTPKGDYLLTVIAGKGHYGFIDPHCKVNDILLYRSKDKGKTWSGPTLSTSIAYNQHAWVPLVPRGSKRIYMFGTEPSPQDFTPPENAGIAFRYSDDDGHTWSGPERIRPKNDPGFQGMWCIRMTETPDGAWLLAPHAGTYDPARTYKLTSTTLFVMRSEDQGKNWTLLPGARPKGWQWQPAHRMDEGRPLALGGGKVVLFTRTEQGHLWQLRSNDDGRTWSDPAPTPLVHPDAPPMIEMLSDGKTIIALHHNRGKGGFFNIDDRSELWMALSHDGGVTWTEPRFLMSSATATSRKLAGNLVSSLTYCDLIAEDGVLNIFLPHLWRQVLQVRMKESELEKLPTRRDLYGS
jgi:Neuraminidase (sialidase)